MTSKRIKLLYRGTNHHIDLHLTSKQDIPVIQPTATVTAHRAELKIHIQQKVVREVIAYNSIDFNFLFLIQNSSNEFHHPCNLMMVADMPSLFGTGTAVTPPCCCCVLSPLNDDTHRSFSDDDEPAALHFEPPGIELPGMWVGPAPLVAATTLSVLASRFGSGLSADTVASALK